MDFDTLSSFQNVMRVINVTSLLYVLNFLRRVRNPTVKKWASSGHGLFSLVAWLGWGSMIYLLLLVLGSSIIILHGNKRYCHLVVFVFTYFIITIKQLEDYIGLPKVPALTTFVIAHFMFKLVHLALEVQGIYCGENKNSSKSQKDNLVQGHRPKKIQKVDYHEEIDPRKEEGANHISNGDHRMLQAQYCNAKIDHTIILQEVCCALKNDSEQVQVKGKDWETERNLIYFQLSILEIIHFNINSVSICNFMTYRTYYDWIHHPFRYARCREEVLRRIKGIVCKLICMLLIILIFRVKIKLGEDFYQSTFLLRVFHSMMLSFSLRLFLYSLFSTLTMLVAVSGFGVYPTATKPTPGGGPTTRFDLLEQISKNPERGKDVEYTFETVCNGDILRGELKSLLRDYWRFYNRNTSYFCKENIFKRFPVNRLKMFATFFLSAYFHGFQGGFWFSLNYSTLYIPVEDLWNDLYRKDATGFARVMWDAIFFFLRLQALTYILVNATFTFSEAYRFTKSMYFLHFMVPIVLYVLGKCLQRLRFIYTGNL